MSVPEVAAMRAETDPDGCAYVFLDDRGEESVVVTYGELHRRAQRVASELRVTCRPGDRALLLFGQSPYFVISYLACLYSGVLAVPVAPPRRNTTPHLLASVIADCAPAVVLTDSVLHAATARSLDGVGGPSAWIIVDELTASSESDVCQSVSSAADDVAFLQYTSGSTSDPKGVVVTHGNLTANQEMIRDAFGHDENSTVVGWAPFFHDQGLIGNLLQPLYVGATAVLLSPGAFIRRPLLWLTTIARYRAHTSGGPNFAFDACVARSGAADLTGLDLSSWTVAFNGAEPIRPDTLRRFTKTFAPYGFREEAMFPCYGLAEATLLVTASRPGRGALTVDADADGLSAGTVQAAGGPRTSPLVGSGTAVAETEVQIVDPDTSRVVDAGRVGEIWVAGPQVAAGYWGKPEATARNFDAVVVGAGDTTYLRTGDLGVLLDGELHVVGRVKDLVIIRGKNHYPQDIEHTAQRSHPTIRPGGCAAFAVSGDDGERLVIVAEVAPDVRADALSDIATAIRGAVTTAHEVSAGDVVVTVPGALDKTTSGKIRRSAARHRYEHNGFPAATS